MIANKYNISLFNIFVNSFLKIFLHFFKKFIIYSKNAVIMVFREYIIQSMIIKNQSQITNYLNFLYNKQNMERLNQSIQNVKEGKTTLKEYELIEVE